MHLKALLALSLAVCCWGFLPDYEAEKFFYRPPRFIFRSGNVRPSLISGRGLFRPGFNGYSTSWHLAEPNFGRISKRSTAEASKKPKISYIPGRRMFQHQSEPDQMGKMGPFEFLQIELEEDKKPGYINEVHDNNFIMPIY